MPLRIAFNFEHAGKSRGNLPSSQRYKDRGGYAVWNQALRSRQRARRKGSYGHRDRACPRLALCRQKFCPVEALSGSDPVRPIPRKQRMRNSSVNPSIFAISRRGSYAAID